MEQSILKSTKKLVGIDPDDATFDLDIVTHINTAFSHLRQLGIGPPAGFSIDDTGEETWEDFLPNATKPIFHAVKNAVALRVRMDFDPPSQWHVLNAMTNQIAASDWHLSVLREETDWVDPDPEFMVIDGGDPSGTP